MVKQFVFAFVFLSFTTCQSQSTIEDYQGRWEGKLVNTSSLKFEILVENLDAEKALLTIANPSDHFKKEVFFPREELKISIDDNTQLDLQFSDDRRELMGFLKSGSLMYHITLRRNKEGNFSGTWNPFMIDYLQSKSIYLSVEMNEDGTFATYPFFGDRRFTGTWASDFTKDGDLVLFRDSKTGLNFRLILLEGAIQLDISFANEQMASAALTRSESEWVFETGQIDESRSSEAPIQSEDGWLTGNLVDFGIRRNYLDSLIKAINADQLENTNSVLIAKSNTLIFEAYFDGFKANIPHDQRSGSKSISSAMIGIAIDDRILDGAEQKINDCMPPAYRFAAESSKAQISIHDLLTMSSGLDVSGRASEGTYQDSDNWLKTVVDAPSVHEPGTHTDYGSANPFLLGVCLIEKLDIPLEQYMNEKLLRPLGISNYIIQTDDSKTSPYFGGGMYLTPRDMLKFGQLYLNKGRWKGNQIISEGWIEASFRKHTRLQDVKDKNEYGYQWCTTPIWLVTRKLNP